MFADILVQHAYSRKQSHFTYEVPANLELKKGQTVLIPFQKRDQSGLVLGLHNKKPNFNTRPISESLPDLYLREWQMELLDWLTEYYFCSKLDAAKLMLPKALWRVPKRKQKSKMKKHLEPAKSQDHTLTKTQARVLDAIKNEQKNVSLIHGVTGSGKTEIYKQLIQEALKAGKQALLLVPEISLTPQLLKYLEGSFPRMAVIHSRVSEGKRAKIWKEIHSGAIDLVVGSRSALFSPFKKLGLIIMDEEHEWTYKQEQSPRYHARTVAEKMIELTGARLVLGSATPSIESMYKAQKGIYSYHALEKRISGTLLPKVFIADMKEELKGMNYGIFSHTLEQKISAALAKKEQVILFLNRRGSASATLCRDCGKVAECPHCDSPLTYHVRKPAPHSLVCHHCGRISKIPQACPHCSSPRIKHVGMGTERVETELQKNFPTARIHRADRDSMAHKDSFKDLHQQLHAREIDILIGTQMIGKGFDIPHVSLVGVILADMGLHLPDFRASERSFQLLTQVAGRAGRREKRGEVVIQTYAPEHPAIQASETHDYQKFYEREILAREEGQLPPFSALVKCITVDKSKSACQTRAQALHAKIMEMGSEGHQVFIAPALTPRINGKYYWHLILQGPQPSSILKKIPLQLLEDWRIDVDPVHVV